MVVESGERRSKNLSHYSPIKLNPKSLSRLCTIPDPEESREPWFTSNMLVPVLIGLDFIHLHGLIVDFNDGTTVCAKHHDPKPFNYIVTPRII